MVAPWMLLAQQTASETPTPTQPSSSSPPKNAVPRREPYRVSARHILFLHRGSFNAKREARTEAEALALAQRTLRKLRSGDLSFERACETLSEDDMSSKQAGYMGILARSDLSNDFKNVEDVLFALRMDEISSPVKTPLGVHLFRRIAIREWAGSHILIQYKGRENAPPNLQRTHEQAKALADKILAATRAPDADFDALARRHSDAPDAPLGGSLGVFGRYEILPTLEDAITKLKEDAVGGPIHSPLGFHIIRRTRIDRIHAAHILIRYRGVRYDEGVFRSRQEALAFIEKVLVQARKPGIEFAALARQFSEDAGAKPNGSVGLFGRGRMHATFEKTAYALKISEISDIVETDHGFHIIQRLPVD